MQEKSLYSETIRIFEKTRVFIHVPMNKNRPDPAFFLFPEPGSTFDEMPGRILKIQSASGGVLTGHADALLGGASRGYFSGSYSPSRYSAEP
jgi:hypothetical protein